jgi:hypothetical protein
MDEKIINDNNTEDRFVIIGLLLFIAVDLVMFFL